MTSKTKLFKQGLNNVDNSVLIGGVDQSELPTRDNLLKPIIEEAEAKAKELADQIISEAEKQAEELTVKTQNELATLEQNAADKGYQEGFDKGFNEATEKVNNELSLCLKDCSEILLNIEQERKECLEDEEERLLKFIVLLCKKIIYRELSYEPTSILELIKQSIKKLDNKSEVKILINSQTANKLNEIKEQIISECPGLSQLNISSKDSLDKGDFILESNRESLDCRLETQIEELLDLLTE